jgi:hypothetical protein
MLRPAFLVLLLAAATATAGAEPFDRRYMIAAAKGVVRVEAGEGDARYMVGTGTVTGPREVATAHHVVRGAKHVYVVTGGLRRPATVARVDPVHDICVLAVDNLEARPLRPRPSGQLQIGEPVAAIGYSGGGGLNFTTGEVTHLHPFSGGQVVENTAAFTSGASGGPLLDSEGRLVGILMFRGMNGAGHFYAVPVEWLGADPASDQREAPPFWQETEARLPYFMRASLLQGESRWDELQALAADWSRDEPANAEPIYVRAQAEAHRGDVAAAARSYTQAVQRDQRHALAWLGLTQTMLQLGRSDCAGVAYARLAALSPARSRQAAEAHPELGDSMEAAACELF